MVRLACYDSRCARRRWSAGPDLEAKEHTCVRVVERTAVHLSSISRAHCRRLPEPLTRRVPSNQCLGSRPQPAMATNSRSLKGKLTRMGLVWCVDDCCGLGATASPLAMIHQASRCRCRAMSRLREQKTNILPCGYLRTVITRCGTSPLLTPAGVRSAPLRHLHHVLPASCEADSVLNDETLDPV